MAVLKRVYGAEPEYNYYIGNLQGGREAMTVVQRYPVDMAASYESAAPDGTD